MACRQRPAHRPTPLLESALSPLFPSLLKKHTHSHALLPSKKENPLLFTFYICYKVIPCYHISNVKEESTIQTLLYGAQIITQNEQDEIHKEGWILLEDDRIIGIGAGAPPEVPEGTVKRCLPGRVIMPGIVNIHTHVGGTLFKGLTEDIKGAFYGLAFPWNALSPGNPCTASVCWGPWRPSNSAPPSSMTCTTSRNPPPARRRSWVCAASSHKRSTTQTCKTCTITIILRCRGRPPKSCRPNRYH